MKDDDKTTIDEAVAVQKRLADKFEQAVVRYDAEVDAGNIGYEAFRRLTALGEELAKGAENLQARIDAAVRAL